MGIETSLYLPKKKKKQKTNKQKKTTKTECAKYCVSHKIILWTDNLPESVLGLEIGHGKMPDKSLPHKATF